MKKNYIYIIETKNGAIWEGIYVNTFGPFLRFSAGSYMFLSETPAFIRADDVVRSHEVCESTPSLTLRDYNEALCKISA